MNERAADAPTTETGEAKPPNASLGVYHQDNRTQMVVVVACACALSALIISIGASSKGRWRSSEFSADKDRKTWFPGTRCAVLHIGGLGAGIYTLAAGEFSRAQEEKANTTAIADIF